MKRIHFLFFALFLFCVFVSACSKELEVTVLYDHAEGVRPEDRVVGDGKTIGRVEAIEVTPKGRFAVRLRIARDFRQDVTDQCRFFIQDDPQRGDHRSVEIVGLGAGGTPLRNRATVEGSSSLSVWLEQGRRALEIWSEGLQEEIDRWKKELLQVPVQEMYEELERQIEHWAETLGQAEEEVDRYFKQEVLPRLEEAVREFERYLKQQGREEDTEPLERKLEELKGI
jgi:hypothetical protein